MSQDSMCVFSLGHCYHAGCREVTCISSVVFPILTCLVYRTHCNCFSVFPVMLVASVVSTALLLWSVLSWESERSVLRCPGESFHSCCSLHPPVSKSSRPLSLPPHWLLMCSLNFTTHIEQSNSALCEFFSLCKMALPPTGPESSLGSAGKGWPLERPSPPPSTLILSVNCCLLVCFLTLKASCGCGKGRHISSAIRKA